MSQDDVFDISSLFSDNGSLGDMLLNEALKKLDPSNEEAKKTYLWQPQNGPQSEAFYSKADELFYGGSAGGGKGGSVEVRTVTPFGFKRLGDIKVNDQVCAADGTVARVLRVYELGEKELYKFTFADGATTLVTEDHLWLYHYAGKRVKAQREYILEDEFGTHTQSVRGKLGYTSDLYQYHLEQVSLESNGKRPYWLIIPLTKPVKFTYPVNRYLAPHKINPYVLGVLLGDGCITGNSNIAFANIDEEIISKMRQLLAEMLSMPEDNVFGGSGVNHNLRAYASTKMADKLNAWGLLGTYSDTKFIPDAYLFGSIEDRFSLLQGLMDTDGYVDDRGHASYTSVSEQLAKDVQQLARSLGMKATVTSDIGSYRNGNGEKVECQRAYTVYLQGDIEVLQKSVSLSRKKDRLKAFNGGVSEAGRRIVNIEKAGVGEARCIKIDHPQGLYLQDDFIVTHNTDLIVGLAASDLSPQEKTIIFRRDYGQLKGIVSRINALYDNKAKFNGNDMIFYGLPGNKTIEFGSIPYFEMVNKYKGRDHDFVAFDEVSDFSEVMYTFLIGWARTVKLGVPVRVVGGGNPPTSADGEWVIRRWGAWIDPQHENPAVPGELRYYATIDGEDTEMESGDSFIWKGDTLKPKSRTFIPARLDDNLYLARTDYKTVLQNMPEPYRSQLLYGDFGISMMPDPWQVIPRDWVNASVQRWKTMEEDGTIAKNINVDITFGLDVGESGPDMTVLVKMSNNIVQWIKYLKEPDLMKQVEWVQQEIYSARRSYIAVDANGVGSGLASRLKQLEYNVVPVKTQSATKRRLKDNNLGFANLRCDLWWSLREALDPDGKFKLCIPKDARLIQELPIPRYVIERQTIYVDSTPTMKEKLGRSPDAASALMLAIYLTRSRHQPPRIV